MNIPDNLLKYNWSKNKGLCLALLLLSICKWPKNKQGRTSVLQLSENLGWSWRTVDKEIKNIESSGFIRSKPVLVKGIKKLEIYINTGK